MVGIVNEPPSVAITAADVVPGMVERAARHVTTRPVTWDVADALELPYDDGSFDAVPGLLDKLNVEQ